MVVVNRLAGFHLENCPRGDNCWNLDFKGGGHDGYRCDKVS